jgi:hypothetical protein
MWDALKERWNYTADWEAHKREMMRRFEKLHQPRLSGSPDLAEEPVRLKQRIQ